MMVVNRTTERLPETRKKYLPRKDNQARVVAKQKKRTLDLPPAPSTFEFAIPEKLLAFDDGNLFVLHDTGPHDSKVQCCLS